MSATRPRFAAPSRRFTIVALLALAAAAAAQAHLPLFLRAPLGYLLVGVIPGWLLAESLLRSPSTTVEERGIASLALSIPLAIAGRMLAFAFGLPAPVFLWAWACMCALGCLLLRPRPAGGPPADRIAWLVAAALALLVGIPGSVNLVVQVSGDGLLHAQIVSELRLRGIPPQNPSYAGLPMNYMWQLHVWVVALVEATGLSVFRVFPLIGGAMMGALALGVYRLASLFWGETLYRRLAPAVVALGMNALGWVLLFAHLFVSPFVGKIRGPGEFRELFSMWVLHPNAHLIDCALLPGSYFVLCSFLFKFFCPNAIGTGLMLVVATFMMVAARVHEGGKGRLAVIGVLAMSAATIHPVVGVTACLAMLAGLVVMAFTAEGRARALAPALAVAIGLALAVPVIWLMLHSGLSHGAHARIHVVHGNLSPLARGIAVVLLPALWGWTAVRRRSPALASLGLGFSLACLAVAVGLDSPVRNTETYPIYTAYLGVALFAAAGVGMLGTALARRLGAVLAWILIALVFLPSALLMFNGYARWSPQWGLAGYPETADEIALFDYARDHTALDATLIDLQATGSSSAASYSERRCYFGGGDPGEASVLGFPAELLATRRRTIVNLLLEPGLDDSTLRVLRAIPKPLYIVARRTLPPDLNVPRPERPIDAVAKLDALPGRFVPVMRTGTLALYRLAP